MLQSHVQVSALKQGPAVANLLSAAVAQGEGERLGEVFGRGGFQVDGLGHAVSVNRTANKERTIQRRFGAPASWNYGDTTVFNPF